MTSKHLVTDRESFFRDAKAFLSRSQPGSSDNVYDHVGALLLKIAEEKPTDAFTAFERYSFQAKQDALEKNKNPEARYLEHSDQGKWDAHNNSIKGLFRTREEIIADLKAAMPPVAEDEEPEEPELPEPNEGHLPDLLSEQRLLEWAGAGFGPEETYRIALSVKALLEAAPLEHVRLWGKVLGVRADYYIVESKYRDGEAPDSDAEAEAEEEENDENQRAQEEDEEDEAAREEAEAGGEEVPKKRVRKAHPKVPKEKGEGLNKFTYWVSTDLGGAWTRLPNVTPQQVQAARKIKRFFTGDLAHEVASYPPFPGTEAAYLRAQIARITHATAVSPRGMFVPDEAADEGSFDVVKNEEFEPLSVDELADLEGWVHHEPKILLQGRAKFWAPEEEEEEEEDEEGKEKEEKLPLPAELLPEDAPAILTGISEDAPLIEEVVPAWSTRVCSVHMRQYAVVAVQSNVWPGALTVARGKETVSLYVGYGHKYLPEPFQPAPLPKTADEPRQEAEQEDPSAEEELARVKRGQRDEDENQRDEDDEDYEDEDN